MNPFISLGLLCIPLIIGFINLILSIRTLRSNYYCISKFYNNFIKYGNSKGEDYETYDNLLKESIKVQHLLGSNGIMYNYRPAYSNSTYQSIQVIVNFLPDLNKSFRRDKQAIYSSNEVTIFYFNTIRECLVRVQGHLDHQENNLKAILKNPFKLFNYGVKTILHFPFYMLASFDVISEDASEQAFSNKFFNFIGTLISMLGLLGTVITIITGWTQFIKYLKNLI